MERALLSGLRRRGFAFASFAAVAAMVSGLLLIQLRLAPTVTSVAVVVDGDRMVLPTGYRQWIPLAEGGSRVYIDPSAYEEYVRSGVFPDGTVIVREDAASAIQVSMKDGRFEEGWGFFDFSGGAATAAPATEEACRSCHERDAETDHVFTQFYPGLRRARGQSS